MRVVATYTELSSKHRKSLQGTNSEANASTPAFKSNRDSRDDSEIEKEKAIASLLDPIGPTTILH